MYLAPVLFENMKTEDWFKIKKYPHIGNPFNISDYLRVKDYVTNKENIRKHSFLPFIHKKIVARKFRPDDKIKLRNPSGKWRRIIIKPKERDIHYATHWDAMVFSFYNTLLVEKYENKIKLEPFNSSVVAYRKIPVHPGSKKNKCNIDFAKSSFEFIRNNNNKELTVIVADITKFFNNLNHKKLKKSWYRLLDRETLPPDHYNLFKALTRLRYVEANQLFKSYNKTMRVQRSEPYNSRKQVIKRVPIKYQAFFKEKNAISFCTKKEFVKNNLNLIISKSDTKGIPQGTAISATLANIYMWDFDVYIHEEIEKLGGFYQRYSDDLIIVCESKYEDEVLAKLRTRIAGVEKLEIQVEKTKVYRFNKRSGQFRGFEIDEKTKVVNLNRTLEYLGFSFDGQRVLIKTNGFSKYYRGMKRSIRKSTSLALNSKNKDKRIFKSRLYKRLTFKGAKRRRIYLPSKTDPTKYDRPENRYYWGNYLSYIYKANDTMRSINGDDSIKRQGRRFWNKFHLFLKPHEERVKKRFQN